MTRTQYGVSPPPPMVNNPTGGCFHPGARPAPAMVGPPPMAFMPSSALHQRRSLLLQVRGLTGFHQFLVGFTKYHFFLRDCSIGMPGCLTGINLEMFTIFFQLIFIRFSTTKNTFHFLVSTPCLAINSQLSGDDNGVVLNCKRTGSQPMN